MAASGRNTEKIGYIHQCMGMYSAITSDVSHSFIKPLFVAFLSSDPSQLDFIRISHIERCLDYSFGVSVSDYGFASQSFTHRKNGCTSRVHARKEVVRRVLHPVCVDAPGQTLFAISGKTCRTYRLAVPRFLQTSGILQKTL